MEYRKVTLANGLRVLVGEMPETRSVSLAVYVGIGSRIETKDDAGTSHFLEHMVFKGSAKRPTAADISQIIESKGGVVNASTDKEVTVFWSRVPARHYLVALEVIADLIRAPMLRPKDVESERNVIVEELRMYRDQPQDRVHTLVDELLYPRHPLGWEVAGREEVVLNMTADRLREFMERGYAPSRTVVALAGPLNADEAIAAVDEALGGLAPREVVRSKAAPRSGKSHLKLLGKRAEQTNLCVGWRSVHTTHADKYNIDMLNAVLGEGMSSRLFLELREKRGLAYDVHSYDANYSDAGHLVVYAGFAPQNGAEVLKAIMREVERLRDELVPDVEIDRVRDFAKGRLELRLEDTRGVSGWLAGQELFLGRIRTVEEVSAIIDGVTAADMQRVAREYLRPELAYMAAIGPRASLATIGAPTADEVAVVMAS
jgi:predicted Zn-dependent peptidase